MRTRRRGRKLGRSKEGRELRSVFLLEAEDDAVVDMADRIQSNKARYCREAVLQRLQRDRLEHGLAPLDIPDLPATATTVAGAADYGAAWSRDERVRRLALDLAGAIVEIVEQRGGSKKP